MCVLLRSLVFATVKYQEDFAKDFKWSRAEWVGTGCIDTEQGLSLQHQESREVGGQGVISERHKPSRWPQHRVCEGEKTEKRLWW